MAAAQRNRRVVCAGIAGGVIVRECSQRKEREKKKDRSFSPSFVDPAGRASLDYAQHTHSTIAPLVSSGVINVE